MSICVWFKKDLRINDHEPLLTASSKGTVIPLYIIEPEIIYSDQFGSLHWNFIRQSLVELNQKLTLLGQPLIIKKGEQLKFYKIFKKKFPSIVFIPMKKLGMPLPLGETNEFEDGLIIKIYYGRNLLKMG